MCGGRNCNGQWATFTTECRAGLWCAATTEWILAKVSQAWSGNIWSAETNPQCCPSHPFSSENIQQGTTCKALHLFSMASSHSGCFCWLLASKSIKSLINQNVTLQVLSWKNRKRNVARYQITTPGINGQWINIFEGGCDGQPKSNF